MSTAISRRLGTRTFIVLALVVCAALAAPAQAPKPAPTQKLDEAYTKLIKDYTQDPRISTELVDHMPLSATVPSPLKFLGRIPGTPGELTYAKDIQRYYEALAKASPRFKYWTIGKTEEGRDMVLLAVADEQTIKTLDTYKANLNALTDPRKTTEEQAKRLIKTSKPIYWVTAGMHSGETGGPEMLIELPYRLAVEETPFIQAIRNNVIVFITPVLEVDGREKHVDTYYYGKKTGKQRPPLVYWGKYVAHDNNRDAMGQMLKLTQNVNKTFLEWKPTILHDLHEAQNYLYASTGTGPYNEQLDPITIDEWWTLANVEVMEMAKRGVPGVWTYGFYDGWVPNYMFFIAHTKNAVGRFYEVQSYGPDIIENLRMGDERDEPRVVPAEPAAAGHQVGPAQQHEHPGVGAPVHAELRGQEPGDLPRELLAEEQACREQGQDRGALRLGDPGGAAPQGRRGAARERPAAAGSRVPARKRRVQGGNVERQRRRLHHPRRPALPHDGRHVLQPAELRARQPAAVRRHGLDDAADAQREADAGRRQDGPRPGHDADRRPM